MLAALSGGTALAQGACQDRATQEECYDEDPYPDVKAMPPLYTCQWPEPPEGPEGTRTWFEQVCVPAGPGGSCDNCAVDEIDALLQKEIATECCEPVQGFLRGCHWLKTYSDEREDECCYVAAYFSTCEEPGIADEPPCPGAT